MATDRMDVLAAHYSKENAATDSLQDLRRRIEVIEKRWPEHGRDVEKGFIRSDSSSSHEYGHPVRAATTTDAVLASLAQYYSQGHQHRVATPAPMGLYSFGLTLALFTGHLTGWTEPTTTQWTVVFALFFGGLVQLLAGQWELWRNNVFGGTVFSSYGAFWLGYAIYVILTEGGVLTGAPPVHGAEMALFLWGILTFIFFMQTIIINAALAITFFLLTVTLFLVGCGSVGHPTVLKIGGYVGVVTSAMAWYVATAELTNSVYRRSVLPLGVISQKVKEPSLTGVNRPDTL